ncbi:non-specific lipid transfer protein GPI-anchored 1-like [Bidens hawaiensis]|uniref:non-specific lipid transfer protein GPI-anchored 1-like n=1 Tax=Bidens hawaiensis TaxID=980011 RepID=UPI004048FCD2
MWNKGSVLVAMVTLVLACGNFGVAEDSLAEQCSSKLTAVMTCVGFATGQEAKPQPKCCDSVKDMKDSNPACLCFFILQIHNGTNPMLKTIKVQESRLLQLSSECNIANASISDCPELLKLPSNSSDAAIFKRNTTIVPPTSGRTPSSTTTSPSGTNALKYSAPGIQRSTWIPLAFLLIFSSTNVFHV